MRIVMFGTGPFAVPTLAGLLQSEHSVLALVTRPIEDSGKRRKLPANPMRDLAIQHGLVVFDPVDANAPEFVQQLWQLKADLLVVCDFGQILSSDCLRSARLGGVNLHGSLLPKYRGAAPVHWAILRGETKTGVTVIHLTDQLDGGPILATAELPIRDDDTTATLEPRLAEAGVELVLRSIRLLHDWNGQGPIGSRQDPSLVTRARRLKKEDGLINWSSPAARIARQVRAFQPWPGAFTHWRRANGQTLRLIVSKVSVIAREASGHEPGQVVAVSKDRLEIQTGQGCISIDLVQPAGKNQMDIATFLRGNQVQVGDRLE